ncbi:MAG: response regulator transcription factor [Chloroflexi bacterium]|nr:response regulator transcription factor [Chloroflexota bacterium]
MTKPLALIIEDDKKLADVFSLTLQKEFDIEVVGDGKIALTRLANLIPALVVLDLHLPQASGEIILRQIRADKRLTETRVMLTTADAQMADVLREEVDLVLLKPISVNQLHDLAMRLRPPDTVID